MFGCNTSLITWMFMSTHTIIKIEGKLCINSHPHFIKALSHQIKYLFTNKKDYFYRLPHNSFKISINVLCQFHLPKYYFLISGMIWIWGRFYFFKSSFFWIFRCGALQVGDLIETINGRNAGELSLQEAIDLLSDSSARSIKLRVLPCPDIGNYIF